METKWFTSVGSVFLSIGFLPMLFLLWLGSNNSLENKNIINSSLNFIENTGSVIVPMDNELDTIPMLKEEWHRMNTGDWEETAEGVKIIGTTYRHGNILLSKKEYDFSQGGEMFVKWQVSSSGFSWITTGLNRLISHGKFSTNHSYSNSILVQSNVWYYSHIVIDDLGNYTSRVSQNNYVNQGGAVISTVTGTAIIENWQELSDRANVILSITDNYSGTSATMTIGEVIVNVGVKEVSGTKSVSYSFDNEESLPAFFELETAWSLDGQNNYLTYEGNTDATVNFSIPNTFLKKVSFDLKFKSARTYGNLRLYADDFYLHNSFSFTDKWHDRVEFVLPEGTQTISWSYDDSGTNSSIKQIQLDNIVIEYDTTACSKSSLNAEVLGNFSVFLGDSTSIIGNPTGGSGNYIQHHWEQIGGNGQINFESKEDTLFITGLDEGTITMEYKATDSDSCYSVKQFDIIVESCLFLSSIKTEIIGDMKLLPESPSKIFSTNSVGGSGTYINYQWEKISGNGEIEIVNHHDGTATITGQQPGFIELQFTVTDSEGCVANTSERLIYAAEVFTVNTTDNVNDGACDDIHCSLKEAMEIASNDGRSNLIAFQLSGDGPHYFSPDVDNNNYRLGSGDLLDGTTQSGNYPMNNQIILNADSFPRVSTVRGIIDIRGSNSTLRGIKFVVPSLPARWFSSIYMYGFNHLIEECIFVDSPGLAIQTNGDALNNPLFRQHIRKCDFSNNRTPILNTRTYIKLTENKFSCNTRILHYPTDSNRPFVTARATPTIINIGDKTVEGTSLPLDIIEVFIAYNSDCEANSKCQGTIFLGKTQADSGGNWVLSGVENINPGDLITANATGSDWLTSDFSNCFVVLPDYCFIAQTISMNKLACSTSGIILDLKQMKNSNTASSTSCSNTYVGNDVWCKIQVPSTGNFLLRTSTNNTVIPVVEIYTECGNNALPECQILDSLPYLMVFENYTPDEILYLRVWDKNNRVVNSASTALLHFTAHKLDSLKTNWEICDYENLISDNPTNLIRREANTFILSYDSDTPQSEINQNNDAFINMMEMELKRECNCGGAPLQLWSTDNPVVMDTRRQYAKRRGNVDTTNYNYIFETVEFQVNSYAIGQQHDTDIAMDAEGNFVMVWKDEQRRHNYGRVYLSSGNPVSVEFQIGSSAKTQYNTRVDMQPNGDFIAVWHEIDLTKTNATYTVYGRLFNADGTPKSSTFNISTTSANTSTWDTERERAKKGTNPVVATDANGNFVVLWQAEGYIYGQRFNSNGSFVGKMWQVANTLNADIDLNLSISMRTDGQFIIVWNGLDENEKGIFAKHYYANGTVKTYSFLVNDTELENQANPDVALAEDGSFIIVWESDIQIGNGEDFDVFGQRFDSDGNKIGGEFLVNTYKPDNQKKPSVSLFENGKFLIAWSSVGQDGFAEGIYAKLFDSNGNPIMPSFDDSAKGSLDEEFRMNTYNAPQQDKPRTTTNGENIFMGAWEDGANDGSFEGIFAQRYETVVIDNTAIFYPIGTATPSTLLGDEQHYPTVTYDPGTSVKKAKVAILDTGIDHTHDLIKKALWYNPEVNDDENCLMEDEIGYDFVNEVGTPIDLDGHGTQVNGILTRNFNSEVKLELMNLKFHELEKGSVFDAICGIYYAVDNGADILNLSWGFEASESPAILEKALRYASDNDVLIITTAGNTSKNNDRINKYPANLDIPNMIVVTAYQYKQETNEIKLANYASHGQTMVDIAAYGYVETAKRGGQKALAAGTSLAAPAVARTAATIKGLYPILTAAEIKACILTSAEEVASLNNKVATGGILDHDAAVACAADEANMITSNACLTSGLTLNANATNESCANNDASISLTFSGSDPNPDFLWSTGDTTQQIANLPAGNYAVTVTDKERCMQSVEIVVENDCITGDCGTNLALNNRNLDNPVYQSNNTITTNGMVLSGSDVVLHAAESITLTTGFQVQYGGEFLAAIESCTTPLEDNQSAFTRANTNKIGAKFSDLSVKLYPNPTQDRLTIEVDKANLGFNLVLYDLMGRQLDEWQVDRNEITINVDDLSAGIYFLRIDSTVVKKFMVGQK